MPAFFRIINSVLRKKPPLQTLIGNNGDEYNDSDKAEVLADQPVSAYAMFFKERQIVAKKSFPEATFGDISRMVAAEWDSLGINEKSAYKRRTEHLRRMHIKMAAKERVQRICSNMGEKYKERMSDEKRPRRDVKPLATRQNLLDEAI
ncbi:HMG box [Ancylostoma ceylanicum]|uniref:HMG box n=1 Tax=Ancylostoma ceylanicum TaxID=53326 RepID=A0A0D6M409_9BILA|nr:HMG box [Ancylostoma ceylanicum]